MTEPSTSSLLVLSLAFAVVVLAALVLVAGSASSEVRALVKRNRPANRGVAYQGPAHTVFIHSAGSLCCGEQEP